MYECTTVKGKKTVVEGKKTVARGNKEVGTWRFRRVITMRVSYLMGGLALVLLLLNLYLLLTILSGG